MANKKPVDDFEKLQTEMGSFGNILSNMTPTGYIPISLKEWEEVNGFPGLPRGCAVEILGGPHSGKSTLSLNLVKEVQEQGGVVVWFNIGEGLDKKYGETIGIDTKRLLTPPVSGGYDLFHKIKFILAKNLADLIVIDCLQAAVVEEIQDRDEAPRNMRDSQLFAKMMSTISSELQSGYEIKDFKTGRKIKNETGVPTIKGGKLIESDTIHQLFQKKACLLFISRLSQNQAVKFGDKDMTGGGKDKDHLFSLRIKVASTVGKTKDVKGEKVLDYRVMTIKNKKNKLGIPFKSAQVKLLPNGRIESMKVTDGEDE